MSVRRYHRPAVLPNLLWGPAVALLVCLPWTGTSSAAEVPTITTKDPVFYVPFVVDLEDPPHRAPREFQLYVSGDRGQSWQLYQQQPPEKDRFSFQAGVDGEFWFAIRTVFADGSSEPEEVTVPELKVTVDRAPPQLTVRGLLSGSHVTANWQAEDAQLDPNSLRIAYRVHPQADWQPVPTKPLDTPPASEGMLAGSCGWDLPAPATGPLQIRATLLDRAGNETVADCEVEQPTPSPARELFAPPSPVAPRTPDVSQPDPHAWQPDAVRQPPVSRRPSTEGWQPIGVPDSPAPSVARQVQPHPPVANNMGQQQPATGRTKMSRSHRFEIEYDIEAAMGTRVHRVEVWFTEDQGRTWRHHGDDPDQRSPYLAEVPRDGTYGFRLLVQARDGFLLRPPSPGDPPDLWVNVDATPPTAVIRSAAYGRGDALGQLLLAWEASDANLAERPIAFYYSERPEGPWRIAAKQLPNSGQFAWQVDDRLPPQVYLRMEVRDNAGNITVQSLREPISRAGLAPQGRIRGVRPTAAFR